MSFSHFEPDECGSLNEWLTLAPRAEALCSAVGALVFVNDGAVRPARGLAHDETIKIGKHMLRFKATPIFRPAGQLHAVHAAHRRSDQGTGFIEASRVRDDAWFDIRG